MLHLVETNNRIETEMLTHSRAGLIVIQSGDALPIVVEALYRLTRAQLNALDHHIRHAKHVATVREVADLAAHTVDFDLIDAIGRAADTTIITQQEIDDAKKAVHVEVLLMDLDAETT